MDAVEHDRRICMLHAHAHRLGLTVHHGKRCRHDEGDEPGHIGQQPSGTCAENEKADGEQIEGGSRRLSSAAP
jgi:hypothetical protein